MSVPASAEEQSRSRTKRLITFVLGGLNMASWLMYATSNWSTEGQGVNLYMAVHFTMLVIVQPLVTLPGLYLAWKGERPDLALLLVAIPWIFYLLGVIAFAIGVFIYGF